VELERKSGKSDETLNFSACGEEDLARCELARRREGNMLDDDDVMEGDDGHGPANDVETFRSGV
jgi:hypothetical protein